MNLAMLEGVSGHLPTRRHSWTGAFIADRQTSDTIDLLNHLEHSVEQAVLFNNCMGSDYQHRGPDHTGMYKNRLL